MLKGYLLLRAVCFLSCPSPIPRLSPVFGSCCQVCKLPTVSGFSEVFAGLGSKECLPYFFYV